MGAISSFSFAGATGKSIKVKEAESSSTSISEMTEKSETVKNNKKKSQKSICRFIRTNKRWNFPQYRDTFKFKVQRYKWSD